MTPSPDLVPYGTERRCREEIGKEYCIRAAVLQSSPELRKWYEAMGYVIRGTIPHPATHLLKPDLDVRLDVMAKSVP